MTPHSSRRPLAPALRWRREPPDVEGWWWRRVRDALLTAPAPTPAPKCDHTLHVDYDTGERWCERCGVSNPSVAPAPAPTPALPDLLDGVCIHGLVTHPPPQHVAHPIPARECPECIRLVLSRLARVTAECDALRALLATASAERAKLLDRINAAPPGPTLAEVAADRDALRAQLREQAAEAHELIEQGREAERAAIVAWLRDYSHGPHGDIDVQMIADEIADGDHLAAKEKP